MRIFYSFRGPGGQFSPPGWVFTLTVSHRRPKDTSVSRTVGNVPSQQHLKEVEKFFTV